MEIIYSDEAQKDIEYWKNQAINLFKVKFNNYYTLYNKTHLLELVNLKL